jgi:hypothetical protein
MVSVEVLGCRWTRLMLLVAFSEKNSWFREAW